MQYDWVLSKPIVDFYPKLLQLLMNFEIELGCFRGTGPFERTDNDQNICFMFYSVHITCFRVHLPFPVYYLCSRQ